MFGVLAPGSLWRAAVVPARASEPADPAADLPDQPPTPGGRWIRRAVLLERVFGFDPLCCTACGGRMKPIAFLEDPAVVGAILSALDLPAEPPTRGKRREAAARAGCDEGAACATTFRPGL